MGLFLVFVLSFFLLVLLDKRYNQLILPYINVEVERLTNNIIQKEIRNFMIQNPYNDLLIQHNEKGDILYDSFQLSVIETKITERLQDLLIQLDNGEVDSFFIPKRVKNSRFHHIRNGILCDVSLSSIRGSSLFANIGPTIPVRLYFIGQLNTEIDVNSKEYGINNILVQVDMIIKVKEQVSMPITSSQKEIVIKVPLIVQLVKGDVPNYYGRSTVK